VTPRRRRRRIDATDSAAAQKVADPKLLYFVVFIVRMARLTTTSKSPLFRISTHKSVACSAGSFYMMNYQTSSQTLDEATHRVISARFHFVQIVSTYPFVECSNAPHKCEQGKQFHFPVITEPLQYHVPFSSHRGWRVNTVQRTNACRCDGPSAWGCDCDVCYDRLCI
jgi:hypothetical protein